MAWSPATATGVVWGVVVLWWGWHGVGWCGRRWVGVGGVFGRGGGGMSSKTSPPLLLGPPQRHICPQARFLPLCRRMAGQGGGLPPPSELTGAAHTRHAVN